MDDRKMGTVCITSKIYQLNLRHTHTHNYKTTTTIFIKKRNIVEWILGVCVCVCWWKIKSNHHPHHIRDKYTRCLRYFCCRCCCLVECVCMLVTLVIDHHHRRHHHHFFSFFLISRVTTITKMYLLFDFDNDEI